VCIALAAYSCRDSRGIGRPGPSSPRSLLSLLRGTGAINVAPAGLRCGDEGSVIGTQRAAQVLMMAGRC
jgi:hypothetical protein